MLRYKQPRTADHTYEMRDGDVGANLFVDTRAGSRVQEHLPLLDYRRLPPQHLGQIVCQGCNGRLSFLARWHDDLAPDEEQFDLMGIALIADHIAGGGAGKEVPFLCADRCQRVFQVLSLAGPHLHGDRGEILLVADGRDVPGWRSVV